MLQVCLEIAVLAALVASLYGWGRAVALLSYGRSTVRWGFATALGVAAWIFLGGMLTALSLVSAYALYVIFLLGMLWLCYFAWIRIHQANDPSSNLSSGNLTAHPTPGWQPRLLTVACFGFAVLAFQILMTSGRLMQLLAFAYYAAVLAYQMRTKPGRQQRLLATACYGCLAAVLAFQLLTVVPARSYHIHDDLMLYLPRVERLLQTGAIHDLFDPTGLDSLGAMPFLQGFVAAAFPLPYIYACDSVFCYLLCGVVLMELARELGLSWGAALVALLLFLSIRIDEHNASPVYAGSLMILLALLATVRLGTQTAPEYITWRAAIPLGLALAGMTALKLSFALFAGCFLLVLAAGALVSGQDIRRRVGVVLCASLVAAAATLPWLLAYREKYLMMMATSPFGAGPPEALDPIQVSGMRKLWEMFSPERTWAFTSRLDYLVVFILTAAAAIVAVFRVRQSDNRAWWASVACAAAGAAVVISFFFWQFFGLDTNNNLRYLGPLPAAVLPAAALLLLVATHSAHCQVQPAPNAPRSWTVAIAALAALVIGLFLNTTMHRAQQAWALPDLIPHDTPDRVHRIQSFAPPGERILVWIKTPQHLEFDRNDLFLVYQSGLVTPWLDFPSEATPQSADVFFRRYGIRYLLRERMERDFPSGDNDINGMHGSRLAYFHRMGRRFAMLRSMIMVAERHHKALYDDGRTVLTDLTR